VIVAEDYPLCLPPHNVGEDLQIDASTVQDLLGCHGLSKKNAANLSQLSTNPLAINPNPRKTPQTHLDTYMQVPNVPLAHH
jgi:hypothetical protein